MLRTADLVLNLKMSLTFQLLTVTKTKIDVYKSANKSCFSANTLT